MASIRPLASHETHPQFARQMPAIAPVGPLSLPQVPEFETPQLEDPEEKPTTPAGRIERWQRKLLDLSLRNRLLNFKETSGVIPFICPDVPYLEDRLAGGVKLKLISYLEDNPVGERDERIHKNRTQRDLLEEFAKAALKRDEIVSSLSKSDMTARLTKLFREVKNDFAEGGTNTLFLAVGFLKWKNKKDDEKTYRAPLLLIPVQLVRKSTSSPFHLVAYDEDVRFNATLIQLLDKDFGCDLKEFEANLPSDEQGIDVPAILDRVRRKIRDVPGFEVVAEAALSTFSFAKYLMWKDLVDRVGELAKNRVVNHLMNDPDKVFSSGVSTPFPEPHHVDVRYHPSELVHPLPADSSQLAAMMAAAEGQDFVLIGPPGTGKSQTIANMIAQCLSGGKTVMFVAEKTAALDVVHRRLREHGLGDCCVELHSNKAERRKFLAQLKNSWDKRRKPPASEWLPISERLKIRRDELNSYVCALHARDACGSTVFAAMGKVVRDKHVECSELGWPKTIRMDAKGYAARCDLVDKLGSAHSALRPGVVFDSIRTTEWTYAWEQQLFQSLAAVEEATKKMSQAFERFCQTLGFPKQDFSLTDLELLKRFCGVFQETANVDYRIIYDKTLEKLGPHVDQLDEKIAILQFGMQATRQCYDYDNLTTIPVTELQNDWREANAKVWGLAHIARRRVRLLLQSYTSQGEAEPQSDLPILLRLQEAVSVIETSPLAGKTPHWRKQETDVSKMRDHIRIAAQARQVLRQLGEYSGDVNRFAKQIAPAFSGGETVHPARNAASVFLASLKDFFGALNGYQKIAGGGLFARESTKVLADTQSANQRIQQQRTELQRWIAWCEIKKRAIANGLNATVVDLESGRTPAKELRRRFELAYARWWLPQAIDRNPILRSFQKFKHEDAIRDFKQLDETARAAASSHVCAVTSHDLPTEATVPKKSELGLLRHQMDLQRPSKSIREIIQGIPESFGKLAPCVLMSPLSVAQYLPANQSLFDVVIFDEASQITTWDAIGAIARGKQTIIVGDPKQLPPTNFFGRADNDEENEELQDHERDLESILDECKASGLPTMQLNWHYRSRHESLIAFSNERYYNNRLITFPSAATQDSGVTLRHTPEAYYDRGKSKTNRKQGELIVADAVEKMQAWLELPESERPTLGVITFNSQQQTLIADLFDQAKIDNPELEWFFSEDRYEPTIVKNLENVQGDERDVMLFSITYGRDKPQGTLARNFGALNKIGGERRLNVAVTRARSELIVYSSFTAAELDANGVKHQGVVDFKAFLDFAERGQIALHSETRGSQGGFDSPFEEAVAEALQLRGWTVVPQVGVSGFRIDLGIVHPEEPGRYLAGVECDGATYHRSTTARDRDLVRESVLKNLGWNIVRIWSPDWWYDPQGVANEIHERLKSLIT